MATCSRSREMAEQQVLEAIGLFQIRRVPYVGQYVPLDRSAGGLVLFDGVAHLLQDRLRGKYPVARPAGAAGALR